MLINLIGDIHGQDSWQQLVRDDAVNVFLGDYFDSKHGHSHDQVVANFRHIIDYKSQHPQTILLYGNHDLNYLLDTDYRSRFSQPGHRNEYLQLFTETEHLFHGVAFAVGDCFISHAGVTKEWYSKYFDAYNNEPPFVIADRINRLWEANKYAFSFSTNATLPSDHWGESPTHSPLWIRAWVLPEHNLFEGTRVHQIIGHTPHDDITPINDHITCIDCLHVRPRALTITPATHNIIGDIHGMTVWKQLVDDDSVNVFVGDFFDPYYNFSFEQCKANFLDIIAYKQAHPQTVLLYGNHEIHYLLYKEIHEQYSRFDEDHAADIQRLLIDHESYFNGVAYSINNQYLVTHAGVGRYWFRSWFGEYDNETPDQLAALINQKWQDSYLPFLVRTNTPYGHASEDPRQSPLWIRPWALEDTNIFAGTPYMQVFGHTPCNQIEENDGLICIDCFRSTKPNALLL